MRGSNIHETCSAGEGFHNNAFVVDRDGGNCSAERCKEPARWWVSRFFDRNRHTWLNQYSTNDIQGLLCTVGHDDVVNACAYAP